MLIIMKDRKKDHIDLTFQSRTPVGENDPRFNYEPLLSAHRDHLPVTRFLGYELKTPLWVSSITGGTDAAKNINHNLAKACREFGMGMGLGSCRVLLDNDEVYSDFTVRSILGDAVPLYANIGINQIEVALDDAALLNKINEMVKRLEADGLIIHVNPLQEWFQPEGDRLRHAPLESIKRFIDRVSYPLIVKEVGQGMGPRSLSELCKLPLVALEFGAFGGTNFSLLELLRNKEKGDAYRPLTRVGHSASQMLNVINTLSARSATMEVKQLIISGGIKDFLDGYYLINKSKLPAVYGMAAGFLEYARGSYDELRRFLYTQVEGLKAAYSFLKIRDE